MLIDNIGCNRFIELASSPRRLHCTTQSIWRRSKSAQISAKNMESNTKSGCVSVLISVKLFYVFLIFYIHIFSHSILANTVGPPDMHITSIYAMGDDDLWFIYSDEHMGGFPCATVLFKQLVAITRLRGSSEDIRLRAEEIFAQIEQFNPESWTEPYDIPEIVEVTLMAKTFKLSVALYGALTLPVENLSIGLKRESLKDELIELIRTGTAYTKCHASLLWPLIVVGTALVDESSKPDQEYVSTLLRDLDFGIGNVSSSGRAYQRITDFWASRKTKWDECWIEPYVCVLL